MAKPADVETAVKRAKPATAKPAKVAKLAKVAKPAKVSSASAESASAKSASAKSASAKSASAKSAGAKSAGAKSGYPEHGFATVAAWSAWLARHHAESPGIAMRIARKGGPTTSITYAQALDEALAWGWIDGQKLPGDAEAWLQRFSPRKPRSIWSKVNRDKVLAMIERGAMQPAGLAAIERAKATGEWDAAYDSPSKAGPPEDLLAALAAAPAAARTLFDALDATNRYAILHRLQTAKQPATRARRLETFVAMLARGETLHPQKRPRKGAGKPAK